MNQTVVNSLAQFQQIVLNEDKAKTFDLLKQFDLIKHNGIKKCNKGHVMEIKEFRNRTDGYVWRCGKKRCQTHKSIRENTFFANGKIKIWQILMIIFNWVAEFMQKTSMQILDVHVLPGTTIYSDMWASYNQIINLDRRYQHRTVNHSINFVAPDGTHTNSIESAWRLAKVQFKRMHAQ